MRIVSAERLGQLLSALPGAPRVVASGNYATPWQALAVLDAAVAEYRLFMLNAQAGVPDRDGVTLETPFVGPGMRGRERLRYFPCRLSLVPVLLASALPPDVVLVHTSAPAGSSSVTAPARTSCFRIGLVTQVADSVRRDPEEVLFPAGP